VNVNIVSSAGSGMWRMRTYERGVEAETLACGTGAVATAVVAATLGLGAPPVEVVTSGGPTLTVTFDRGADGVARAVRLRGTATIIAEGVLHPAAWL
jgi:diaminopimelate epimerase